MYDSHQNYYYAADAARNIDSRTKSYHAANKEFPGDDDEAEQDDETDQHHHVKGVFQHINTHAMYRLRFIGHKNRCLSCKFQKESMVNAEFSAITMLSYYLLHTKLTK